MTDKINAMYTELIESWMNLLTNTEFPTDTRIKLVSESMQRWVNNHKGE